MSPRQSSLFALAIAMLGFLVEPASSMAQTPAAGMIAFASSRADLNSEIYVMNLDGTNVRRLTYDSFEDTQPALSPDGTKVAFVSNRDVSQYGTDTEIYVVNLDGTGTQRLTHNVGINNHPVWSPDGRKIAFYSDQSVNGNGSNGMIFRMDANGANMTAVTVANSAAISWAKTTSGEKIRFNRTVNGYSASFTVNPDGTAVAASNFRTYFLEAVYSPDGTRVAGVSYDYGDRFTVAQTDGTVLYDYPPPSRPGHKLFPEQVVFSADGRKLIFSAKELTYDSSGSPTDATQYDLYSINLNGTGLERLTNTTEDARDPSCAAGVTVPVTTAPTGFGRIVCIIGGNIWTMNPTGWDLRQLTFDGANGNVRYGEPAFSPEGTRIAFRKNRNIWTMAADGSNPTSLTTYNDTDHTGTTYQPAWSPDGQYIAYTCIDADSPFAYHNHVWSMKADGSQQHREAADALIDAASGFETPFPNSTPSWSINNIIVFAEGGPYLESGISVRVAGSPLNSFPEVILSNHYPSVPSTQYADPKWNVTGDKIAYTQIEVAVGNRYPQHIWLMGPNGENPQMLTNGGYEGKATFCPDGQHIGYMDGSAGDHFTTMKLDGSDYRRIASYQALGNLYDANWGANFDYVSPETLPPTVTITDPAPNASTLLAQIQGTAHDDVVKASGVAVVWLKLKRLADGLYWNPGAAAGTPKWTSEAMLLPTDLGSPDESTPPVRTWISSELPANDDLISGQYTVYSYAVDTAGNRSAEISTTFGVIVPGHFVFDAASYSVNEKSGALSPHAITVSRVGGSDGVVTVDYLTYSYGGLDGYPQQGQATEDVDYTKTQGTLTFASGEVSKTIVVPMKDDTLLEDPEILYLVLDNPTGGAALGSVAQADLTIVDDDTITMKGTYAFAKAAYSVKETGHSVTISITRTGGTIGAAALTCLVDPAHPGTATARRDFVFTSNTTVSFADGDGAAKSIGISVSPDLAFEGDKTVNLLLKDESGAVVSTAVLTIQQDYPPGTPTTLTINVVGPAGSGTITPGFAGTTSQTIASDFRLTAFPKPGFIFAGWSKGVTSAQKTITFVLTPKMVIDATFIANPFVSTQGTYAGLGDLEGNTGLAGALFSSKVGASGTFSAKLIIGKTGYGFSGAFAADGTYHASATLQHKLVEIALQLDVVNGTNTITGTITVDGKAYTVGGNRNIFSKSHQAPAAGRYTFIAPSAGGAGVPTGDSWFTVNLKTNGAISILGGLADGTSISRGGVLGADSSFTLYQSLYHAQGVFAADLTFVTPRPSGAAASDVTGAALWQKPAIGAGAAFNVQAEVLGSLYTKPAATQTALGPPGPLLLHFATLPAVADVLATLGTNGKAVSSVAGFQCKVGNSNGAFAGRVLLSPGSAVFRGVVLQKQGVARGVVGSGAAGRVTMTPQ